MTPLFRNKYRYNNNILSVYPTQEQVDKITDFANNLQPVHVEKFTDLLKFLSLSF